jgi:hypothetical protein
MTLYWPRDARENDALAQWCGRRINHVGDVGFGPCRAAAVLRDGHVAAVVVFHDWQEWSKTLQLSMAAESPAWALPGILRQLLAYGFVTAKANKLWTATPHFSERALKFNKGVGLKPEATLRHHFGPKIHAVICAMLQSEWQRSRWNKETVHHG